MKRLLVLLTVPILMLVLAAPAFAQLHTTDLIADGRETALDVGDLVIDSDSANLTVTFQIDEANVAWLLEETHLYIGDNAPSKHSPGRFPYKHEELGGATSDSYSIDLLELAKIDENGDGDGYVYIAAHAGLIMQTGEDPDTGEPIFDYETAWAQGNEPIGKGRNWATCFVIELPEVVE
jgi:hypothetical protein